MPRILLFCFFFIGEFACAQSSLWQNNSIFDSCPDPAKYHIAWRRIYTNNYRDSSYVQPVDTFTETYNRKGQLVSQVFFNAKTRYARSYTIVHHLAYDSNGRILCDSSNTPYGFMFATYEYSADGMHALVHEAPFFEDSATRFVNYNDRHEIISDFLISDNGDTLSESRTHGNITTTVTRRREYVDPNDDDYYAPVDSGGTLITIDSVVRTQWSDHSTVYAALYQQQETQDTELFYDKMHRITCKREYLNDVLIDSYRYTYNSKGYPVSVIDSTFPIKVFPYDTIITVWHRELTYDKYDNLITDKYWQEREPDVIYYSQYFYNDKGLRAEKDYMENRAGKVKVVDRETIVYGYW